MIEEYKRDLKSLRRVHSRIANKKYIEPVRVNGKIIYKSIDERTAEELAEQKILAEAISSTEYALFWLEHGIEKPFDEEQAKKIPKHRRAVTMSDVDIVSYQVYLQNIERPVDESVSNKKIEMLQQVSEIESLLSSRELELFKLINVNLCTFGQAAEQMGIAVGTVKSMSQRIKNKIDNYFEYGHQINLFSIS